MSAGTLSRRSPVQLSLSLRPQDLGRRVLSGASFQFLGIVLRTIITIGSTAILARLLVPADFGYVAMATVVTELAALFANFGLTNILIQRKRITRRQLDTVYWASLGLGAALGLVVFVLSFFAAWLFRDPMVGKLLSVMCLSFVLSALTAIPWVILMRLMRFRAEFWIQMSTMAVRAGVAIACAAAGLGVWSLAVAALVAPLMQAVLGSLAVRYRPRLRFDATLLTSTWRTSSSYFGGGFLFYVNMNLDLTMIGRQLGADALGYYQNARSLTDEVRARIAIPLQHVLFPAFSSAQTDKARLQSMFMRSGRLLAAVVMPIGIGVAVLAQELVPVLYGDRWLAMIPLLAMLGVSAAVRASCAMANVVINAHDQVSKGFRFQAVSTAIMVVAMLVALPFGLQAAAGAQMLVSFYALVPLHYATRLVGLPGKDMVRTLGAPAVASAAMALVITLLRAWSEPLVEHVGLRLVLFAIVAAATYLGVLHAISRQYWAETREVVRRLAGHGQAS